MENVFLTQLKFKNILHNKYFIYNSNKIKFADYRIPLMEFITPSVKNTLKINT
jgi:hypothetical protein